MGLSPEPRSCFWTSWTDVEDAERRETIYDEAVTLVTVSGPLTVRTPVYPTAG